jgi:prepilin-type processing-associated H-X9-DG protein
MATVLLFDGVYGGSTVSLKGQIKDVDYRHNSAANVLFADWHVEHIGKTDLKTKSAGVVPAIQWKVP